MGTIDKPLVPAAVCTALRDGANDESNRVPTSKAHNSAKLKRALGELGGTQKLVSRRRRVGTYERTARRARLRHIDAWGVSHGHA